MKRLLAIFAHPDDEAFGPGGTLAKYADSGVEVHLLCATKGESGQWQGRVGSKISKDEKLGEIREKELLNSAKILGIKRVEFMGFTDGTLCNAVYHKMAEKIIKKINDFRPQVIITEERRGVSGHLDHIAVSMITTYSFLKTNISQKLYYHCLPKDVRDKMTDEYFVYFPEGYDRSEITTKIEIACCWEKKVEAMMEHKSQMKDVNNIITRWKSLPKVDYYILQHHRGVKVKLPETDLFAGIDD